jgi:hypothetical protein
MSFTPRSNSGRPVLSTTRARQGLTGRHVFWVLVFGTLLAALGLFAAWTWYAPDLASTNSNNGPAPALQDRAPEPVAQQNPPQPPGQP